MNEASKKFEEPTLPGLGRPTSSPESEAGRSPCDSPAGPKIGKSGPEAAHASPSRQQGKAAGSKTSAISGPSSSASSKSAALQPSWVSRWLQKLASAGSMEYSLTLKERVTPAGRRIPALRASGRRTSDNGCIGWPTADSQSAYRGATDTLEKFRPSGAYRQETLNDSALRVIGFNTPRATDGTHGGPNQSGGALPADAAKIVGWASPTAHKTTQSGDLTNPDGTPWDGRQKPHQNGRPVTTALADQAKITGPIPGSSPVPTERKGVLDAAFSRWLMGFPETWDEASPNFQDWQSAQETIATAG